jgi:hypothetical protein
MIHVEVERGFLGPKYCQEWKIPSIKTKN